VKGDAQSVKLVSAAGSFSAGPLPAGTYSVKATFEGGTGPIDAGTVTVNAGQTVTVSCDTAFARCKIR
jgi:hypothetical protein